MKLKICILTIFLITLATSIGCNTMQQGSYDSFEEKKYVENEMTVHEVKEDLEFLRNKLIETHPIFKDIKYKEDYLNEFDNLYNRVKLPLTKEEVFFLVLEAIVPLSDGHTNTYYFESDEGLPIEFEWINEGIVITNDYEKVKKGDKIIAFGNKTEDELLNSMRKLIPAENDYRVKKMSSLYLRYKPFFEKVKLDK